MNTILILVLLLIVLFALSAFFSGSETALMSLDRYKLRHMARKNKGAKLAQKLLEKPDRLIGLILMGNNLVNILITQIATYLGYLIGGNPGVALATGILTLMLLIFAELAPKTLAAVTPEKLAFPAARIFTPLLKIAFPLVALTNFLANSILRLLGVDPKDIDFHGIGNEELRTIVSESGKKIPQNHQEMLLSVLDLESTTVEDIMIPRYDISGIDLNEPWDDIEDQIIRSPFTRLLVFRENLDHIIGFIHLRKLLRLFKENSLNRRQLEQAIRPTYFTPESTSLTQQLLNFQEEKRRIALVVDEYGEIQGLVTLEDILEEIVGQFSTTPANLIHDIQIKSNGDIWAPGAMHIRELNRHLDPGLPAKDAKTLNGLIVEHLESIPVTGLCLLINDYPVEIRKVKNNAVKTLIIHPRIEQHGED